MNTDPFVIFLLLTNFGSGMVRADFGSADRRLAMGFKAVRRWGLRRRDGRKETTYRHDIGPATARPTTSPSGRTESPVNAGRNAIMNAGISFYRAAELYRDRPYLYFRDVAVSYEDFSALIRKAVAVLQNEGVGRQDHVAILAINKPEWLACYYAILSVGAVVIPINPALKSEEIAHIVDDSRPKVVFTDLNLVSSVASAGAQPNRIFTLADHSVETSDWAEFRGDVPSVVTPVHVDDEDPSIIYYTSGTTGRPKGAIMPHRSTLSTMESTAEWLGLGTSDTVIITGSFAFIMHSTVAACSHTNAGGTLVIHERFRPQDALAAIEKYRATVLCWVPTMYLMACEFAEKDRVDLTSLRVCISGGAPLPWSLAERFYALSGCHILSGWGMSEGTPITGFSPKEAGRPESIGRPLVHCQVKIIDEKGAEVGPREVGELIYFSPKNMTAYLNRPEATVETLRDGWIYSGDLGWKDEDGYFYISGRKKEMIIRGGSKVYPAEVEEVVLRYDGVAEAAVLGLPDSRFGERVVAIVTPRDGATLEIDSLRQHCEQLLAPYKVPQEFVVRTELPKGPTGKILKRLLRDWLADALT
jgi:long-chain acyl-CoA synthetase